MAEAVTALFALPPEDFTAARDELARRLKALGDRAGAAAVKQLRRPTVAAWLLNLVARERPSAVGDIVDLAARLRGAQSDALAGRGGAALRQLTAERRQVVQAVVGAATELAQCHGRSVAGSHVDEMVGTVEGALADEDLAERWRSGMLTTAERSAGFAFGAADALAVEQRATSVPSPSSGDAPPHPVRRQAAVDDAAAVADVTADRADHRTAGLQRALEDARALVAAAQAEVERCRSASASADQAARAARAALKDALRAATRAELTAATAEQAVWADADRAGRSR